MEIQNASQPSSILEHDNIQDWCKELNHQGNPVVAIYKGNGANANQPDFLIFFPSLKIFVLSHVRNKTHALFGVATPRLDFPVLEEVPRV